MFLGEVSIFPIKKELTTKTAMSSFIIHIDISNPGSLSG